MKVIPGPASKQLGEKIAQLSGLETVPVAFKTFPDGESYIRLDGEVKNETVAIVQTTSPPQDTKLVQLTLIADAAKRNGAKEVIAVVPYLAYARQDMVFLQGEAVSVETVARMLKAAGIDSLTTVNVHKDKVLAKLPFPQLFCLKYSASKGIAETIFAGNGKRCHHRRITFPFISINITRLYFA